MISFWHRAVLKQNSGMPRYLSTAKRSIPLSPNLSNFLLLTHSYCHSQKTRFNFYLFLKYRQKTIPNVKGRKMKTLWKTFDLILCERKNNFLFSFLTFSPVLFGGGVFVVNNNSVYSSEGFFWRENRLEVQVYASSPCLLHYFGEMRIGLRLRETFL